LDGILEVSLLVHSDSKILCCFNFNLINVDNPFSATAQDRKFMRFLWFR